MPILKQLLILAVIAGLGVAGWVGMAAVSTPSSQAALSDDAGPSRAGRRGGGRGGPGAVAVTTAPVAERASDDRLKAIGTADAAASVQMFPQAAGVVTEVLFRAGDRVEAGQPLVRLDDREQTITVESAEIALRSAEEALERIKTLASSRTATRVQLSDAQTAADAARADLEGARVSLARRTVLAPFAGVMGFSEVDVGDTLSSTSPIATIDDRSELHVEFSVPERFAGRVVAGVPVTATTAAFGAEPFQGEVDALDSRIDAATRSLRVRASLPNADDRLRPGMSFDVTVTLQGTSHPAVPELSVQWSREGAFVWKLDGDVVTRTPVEIVARIDGMALVSGALSPDDEVVVEGVQRLREGAQVARSAAPAPAAAAANTGRAVDVDAR